MKISKRYTFDAMHQLKGHQGKCANAHGHTYTVEVCVTGTQLTNNESWRPYRGYSGYLTDQTMLMDYFDLDDIVKPIIEVVDHSFLTAKKSEPIFDIADSLASVLPELSPEQWIAFCKKVDLAVCDALGNVVELPIQRTTAEELSIWFWTKIAAALRDRQNIQLLGIIVSETPKTSAEYVNEVPHV